MDSGNLQKLLPFLNHNNSIRRAGVIMTIKNCCFELGNLLFMNKVKLNNLLYICIEKHDWLLSEDLDLLSHLLLPLAGPEQFDDEDNDKLPLDLQYLSDDKKRESDPNLRLALIQAITQVSY